MYFTFQHESFVDQCNALFILITDLHLSAMIFCGVHWNGDEMDSRWQSVNHLCQSTDMERQHFLSHTAGHRGSVCIKDSRLGVLEKALC